ncbi:MAG: hypothetical protein PVI92_01510 [Chromatiales bacterium]
MLISGCGGGGDTQPFDSPNPIDINTQAKITKTSFVDFYVGVNERFSRDLTDAITSIFLDGDVLFQTGDIDLLVLAPCNGTKHITGSLDEDTSSGTLNIAFSEFQYCYYQGQGEYTISGDVTVQISNTEIYAPGGNITIPSDYIATTSNLIVTYKLVSFGMDGTIEYSHDTSNSDFNTITLTKNIDFQNSEGTASFLDFTYKNHYTSKDIADLSGYLSYSYSGRLYDSEYGYVDVSTVNADAACANPYDVDISLCPLDPTGEGRIKMAGDSSSALIAYTDNNDHISLDADGDGEFEQAFFCSRDGECE